MFVMSVKGKSLKLYGALIAAAIALGAALLLLPDGNAVSAGSFFEGGETVNYDNIKTNEKRIEFLHSFGWETENDCIEETEIRIPVDFDRVMNSYNSLQKAQGFNLDKYKGRSAMRYTYEITNYPDYDGRVIANLIIYKNRVIGGDICSYDAEGFIHGFERQTSAE